MSLGRNLRLTWFLSSQMTEEFFLDVRKSSVCNFFFLKFWGLTCLSRNNMFHHLCSLLQVLFCFLLFLRQVLRSESYRPLAVIVPISFWSFMWHKFCVWLGYLSLYLSSGFRNWQPHAAHAADVFLCLPHQRPFNMIYSILLSFLLPDQL